MPPIAAYLELDRLRYREARLARALRVLEARADVLKNYGHPVPSTLASAISGFREELEATREQLL
ncbi:MAG TPA: hypothetical protein VFB41_08505 [Solirubrobacteraceae bacterium]|nr:hypothetical protein [Solirubrobacteraceae bacterium]